MISNKEQRAYMCEVSTRSDEKHGNVLEGIPIVYDVATDIGGYWEEIIDRGALDSADLKDVRFLVNHDIDSILRTHYRGTCHTQKATPASEGVRNIYRRCWKVPCLP